MRRSVKNVLAVLLVLGIVVFNAFLPLIVAVVDDRIGRGDVSYAEIQAVHLDIRENAPKPTIFDKLKLWYCVEHGKTESIPIPEKMQNWTNEEMELNVLTQLQPYYDNGLITQDISVLQSSLDAALVSPDNEDVISDIIWTHVSGDGENCSLLLFMDDETGKILCIQWEDVLNPIEDQRRVLDRFCEVYLASLELPDEISVEVMTATQDQKMGVRYLLKNKNTGDFLKIELRVYDYGFIMDFL